jgi:CheY-like chemotaxis protein
MAHAVRPALTGSGLYRAPGHDDGCHQTMPQASLASISYLYVEDNDDIRTSICELIAQPHRDITAVASAEAALSAIDDRVFDVLLTDVSLPGMSGTELARRWLAGDPLRWVVLCSGYDFAHMLHTLGPNTRALPKSFEIEDLERLLDDIESSIRNQAPCTPDGRQRP